MDRFTRSPVRGWRWLYAVLGLIVTGTAIYVFIDWPNTEGPKDSVMLAFPALILLGGLGLIYFGVLANDKRLLRFVTFMQTFRWPR